MIALRAEALLLNAALGVGIGLLVSWGTKKITEAAQRVQNVATKSKEAADAAQSTTSSLKDLVSAYEELGDKSGWDTEDFDQAKDIQAEILDLAKEQGTLDENKLSKLDLQNGKYEEQLGLLQDITAEQLEASRYELTQNKDAQGDKLVDTAKKNNRTHYLTVWSAPEMDMGDQIKNAGIDVFNKFGGYGPDDLNDADSIVDYYNEVGKALKYVIDNTNIKLFEEDRDFVLAVDYKMDATNANNTVLMQCFEQNGMNGIRLWNSTGVKTTWGIDSANGVSAGSRDMTVIRHVKGDNGLYVYSSNIYGSALSYTKISRTRITKTNATLVFGCAKADDGAYERHAKGTVYWSKLWYADLGDAACRELAAWTHDNLIVEVASFKNYYLSDNSNKRCAMTFLQRDTLGQEMMLSSAANNAGGWGNTSLREYLNSRLVDALPIGWKQLIKKVKVPSSAGNKSKEIVTSDCYFFIPSAIEVSSLMTDEPYVYEGQTISYMTGNESRIKHNAEGRATKYWLRSPFATYDGYFYAIEETGELYGFHYPSEQLGVTVMFSI